MGGMVTWRWRKGLTRACNCCRSNYRKSKAQLSSAAQAIPHRATSAPEGQKQLPRRRSALKWAGGEVGGSKKENSHRWRRWDVSVQMSLCMSNTNQYRTGSHMGTPGILEVLTGYLDCDWNCSLTTIIQLVQVARNLNFSISSRCLSWS